MTLSTTVPHRPTRSVRSESATHLFAIGQSVRLKEALWGAGNVYLITAKLPPLGDSPQYRIRSEGDGIERVATEHSLERASVPVVGSSAALAEKSFGPGSGATNV